MGKFIEKFKRFQENQNKKTEILLKKRALELKERGRFAEIIAKERAKKEIEKQTRIAQVREAQLRRARAEAGILQAKAKRFKAQRQIAPPLKIIAPSRGLTIRPFNPSQVVRKITKKKKKRVQMPRQPPQQGTPGLGTSFRVL